MPSNTTSPVVTTGDQASRVPYNTLLSVIWVTSGLCVILVFTRLAIHLKFARRLHLDDGLAILALSFLLANSVVTTLMAHPMYDIILLSVGALDPGPNFMERSTFYLKCQFASTMLFWSCLWAVKASFLAFFWRLTHQIPALRRLWWAVMALTIVSYIGCVVTYPVSCTSFVLGACEVPDKIHLSLISLRYSTAVDIMSDAMIMVIPLCLTWRLQMSIQQKAGLGAVLCLGVITIIFSAIRIIFTNPGSQVHPEVSWLALCSALESGVAVIVVCLTSFRVLFTQMRQQSSNRGYIPQGPSERYGRGSKAAAKMSIDSKKPNSRMRSFPLGSMGEEDVKLTTYKNSAMVTSAGVEEHEGASNASERDWNDRTSQEQILSTDGIRVHTSWRVTNS
nr:hypothetical protein B0A51_16348 [Rachicladosporium sp. CCFEE 5018]